MSYALSGPFPFDEKTVTACGRAALSSVGASLRTGDGSDLIAAAAPGIEPGLYVILSVSEGRKPEIAGMWVVLSSSYLVSGPLGPPDKVPPLTQGLLDAATEEVWWQNLHVTRGPRGAWCPLIVVEWPPFLASRSSAPPPGVPQAEEEEEELGEEPENWLSEVEDGWGDPTAADVHIGMPVSQHDRFANILDQRSLILVLRGVLEHDGKLHKGSFFLVPPGALDDGSTSIVPLDEWFEKSLEIREKDLEAYAPEEDTHALGKPLGLFGDRVGFHLSGWLTRGLGIWPIRPSDIAVGALTDRVVQSRWIAQMQLALGSSIVVVGFVLSFVFVIRWLAEPRPEPMDPPPPPAVQPAMSVCSEDNQLFLEEFRCQILTLASSTENVVDHPVCGDRRAEVGHTPIDEDLQAAYCGLLDREIDGWTADLGTTRANFADVAASQACYNVLGHPDPYRLKGLGVPAGREHGDPQKFLRDEELGIEPLKTLTGALNEACEVYRTRVESRVEGAVFATHVGAPLGDDPMRESEAARLRRLLLDVGMVGVPFEGRQCFETGMQEGVSSQRYAGVCDTSSEPDRKDREFEERKIWRKMGGQAPAGDGALVVDRYVHARFGVGVPKSAPALWQCHLGLQGVAALPESVPRGQWDFEIPIPRAYRISGGGPRIQVQMDAVLGSISDGLKAGVCWSVVHKRLSAYKPVHPLLGSLETVDWPSDEQQLCGQICAAYFGVRRSGNASQWVTREDDLKECMYRRPPSDTPDLGGGTLDRLRLPWNYAGRRGWIDPTDAQICAFNMAAQNMFPPLEEGFLVSAKSPKQFGGETVSGSRIVGGRNGSAAKAAEGMNRRGAASVLSVDTCGDVATMCFSSVMVRVMGRDDKERYEWFDTWQQEVEALTKLKREELYDLEPWCVPIDQYLIPDRESAQLDTTCREGVERARSNVTSVIKKMAADIAAAGGPG